MQARQHIQTRPRSYRPRHRQLPRVRLALRHLCRRRSNPRGSGLWRLYASSHPPARTQTTAPCRNSAARHSDLEDSDVEIICNDLSEEESKSCTDLTNLTTPATPEDLPDYVDDDLPPPVDISMIFNEIFSDQEMSETTDKAQCDCPEWLEWMH